jgi:hypothetical protein
MAWIESHQSLGTHLKLRRLAKELRIHRAQAIGHLQFLWWWALDNAPKGDLSALSSAEIEEAAEWPGPKDVFVDALRMHRWLDADGMIHDWDEYAGRLIAQREKDRQRKRDSRRPEVRRPSSGVPMDGDGASEVCPPDVRRTSDGRLTDGEQTAVVPNPTNPTVEEESVCRGSPPALIPPLPRPEFDALAALRGIPTDVAAWVWDTHDARGWTDATGQLIRNVEPVLRRGLVRWQEKQGKAAAVNGAHRKPQAAAMKPDWSDPKNNRF